MRRRAFAWIALTFFWILPACSGGTDVKEVGEMLLEDVAASADGTVIGDASGLGAGDLGVAESQDGSPALSGDGISGDLLESDVEPAMTVKEVIQEQLPEPANFVLRGLWGNPGGPTFAVGQDGVVLRRSSSEWSVESFGLFPYLHGVAGLGATDALAVGVGGARAYFDGAGWDGGDSCSVDSECDDNNSCTDDTCDANLCKHLPLNLPGCCGSLAFSENFDGVSTANSLTIVDSSPNNAGVVWNVISKAGRYTSPSNALFFGNPSGNCPGGAAGTCAGYSNGSKVAASSVTFPAVSLPKAETITARFDLFLDVETGSFDMLSLEVESAGQNYPVWSKADMDGASGKTFGFVPVEADLSMFQGKQVKLRFVFDSVDGGTNSTEGVYIDTLAVSTQCGQEEDLSFKDMPTFFDVAATPDGTYYAVGLNGSVWSYRADRGWQDMMAAANGDWFGAYIKDGLLLVGGSDGRLVQIAGGSTTAPEAGTKLKLNGVRVFEDGSRVAVGDAGTVIIAQADSDFQLMPAVPTQVDLMAVEGSAIDDLTIVGAGGTIVAYDGVAFTLEPTPTTVDLQDVAVLPNGQRFAVGLVGTILENSGSGWIAKSKLNNDALSGISATGVDTVVAVGNYGTILRRDPQTGDYSKDSGVTSKNLKDVHAVAPTEVWAVGLYGTILFFDGQTWTDMSLQDDPVDLYGVASEGKGSVYVVGIGGAVISVGMDGSFESLLGSTSSTLRGVYALDDDHVWAVGSGGTILSGSRNVWAPQYIKEPGPDGEDVPIPTTLYGVWASAPDDVWVVGDGGLTAHYDGKTWKKNEEQKDPRTLRGIMGAAPNDVFAVGTAGSVVHWDGATWSTVDSGTVAALHDLLIDEYGQVLIVGDSGTVLMLERE